MPERGTTNVIDVLFSLTSDSAKPKVQDKAERNNPH